MVSAPIPRGRMQHGNCLGFLDSPRPDQALRVFPRFPLFIATTGVNGEIESHGQEKLPSSWGGGREDQRLDGPVDSRRSRFR